MSKSPWEPEATELRESLREVGYILYRDTPLKWLVRKLGMRPKHWIVEREERDASNRDSAVTTVTPRYSSMQTPEKEA